jgi:hypothetical protein
MSMEMNVNGEFPFTDHNIAVFQAEVHPIVSRLSHCTSHSKRSHLAGNLSILKIREGFSDNRQAFRARHFSSHRMPIDIPVGDCSIPLRRSFIHRKGYSGVSWWEPHPLAKTPMCSRGRYIIGTKKIKMLIDLCNINM